MLISMTDRSDLLSPEMREVVERRFAFALSRFDSRITNVDFVVRDENGPRGGVDKGCRVSISLKRAPEVVITDKDADLATCVSRVAERAGRAVARTIQRTQQFDRSQRTNWVPPTGAGHAMEIQ